MSPAPSTAVCHGRDGCSASSQAMPITAPSSQGICRTTSRNVRQTRSPGDGQ